jgi:hypothetical protein
LQGLSVTGIKATPRIRVYVVPSAEPGCKQYSHRKQLRHDLFHLILLFCWCEYGKQRYETAASHLQDEQTARRD